MRACTNMIDAMAAPVPGAVYLKNKRKLYEFQSNLLREFKKKR